MITGWAQGVVSVSETFTNKQVLTYNESPTAITLYPGGQVIYDTEQEMISFRIICLKGGGRIDFITNSQKVSFLLISVTEKELNDMLITMGAKPDFSEALLKLAVLKIK